jgi:hypothetical protein
MTPTDPIDTLPELTPCNHIKAREYGALLESARRWRTWCRWWQGAAWMVLAMFFILAATGCSVLGYATPEARNAELGWQALHLVDTAQTVTIARSPACLHEANPLARAVYGTAHPSVRRVVLTNTAGAVLHWTAGSWLDRATERSFASEGPNRGALYVARLAYYGLSFLGSGTAVVGNMRLGIKPLTRAECAP